MSDDRESSRFGIIGAIIRKDLREFSRDRFYVLMTVLGLVFYVLIFWLLPSTVDETIRLGVHHTGLSGFFSQVVGAEDQGLDVTSFESSEALAAAVQGEGDSNIVAGIDFPPDFFAAVAAGRATTVRLLMNADIPDELRVAMSGFVRELAFLAVGEELPVTQPSEQEILLGQDRAGDQVSIRERMRPMFAFFVLLIETFALATLVASEIQHRTVTAVLTTPASVSDFLAAKAILGTLLAFTQAALLMAVIRSFDDSPLLLATALLLGSVLVTGVGLVAGSSGRDFLGILFWSMLFLIPLAIPAFGILFPGSAAAWIKVLPSYGLVQAIVGATAYGEGFAEALPDLAMLGAWCVVALGIGLLTLRRKVSTL